MNPSTTTAPAPESATKHTLPEGYRLEFSCDRSGAFVVSATGWRGYGVRYLATGTDKDGYTFVRVVQKGRRVRKYLHRLICEAIHGPKPSSAHEVCHKDGNPANNDFDNLYWGTRQQNAIDRSRHGRCYRPDWSNPEKRARWSKSMRVPKRRAS